jgi:hypothetical protein
MFEQRRHRQCSSRLGRLRRLGGSDRLARPDRCGDHGDIVPVVGIPDRTSGVAGTTRRYAAHPRGNMMVVLLTSIGIVIAFGTSAAIAWSIVYPERRLWPPKKYTTLTPILV